MPPGRLEYKSDKYPNDNFYFAIMGCIIMVVVILITRLFFLTFIW